VAAPEPRELRRLALAALVAGYDRMLRTLHVVSKTSGLRRMGALIESLVDAPIGGR
jgi:hypothetical protein